MQFIKATDPTPGDATGSAADTPPKLANAGKLAGMNHLHACKRPCGGTFEFVEILSRLERIESALDSLLREQLVRDHYSTSEVAEVLRRAEFTVREWCRLGRIKAEKKRNGRGLSAEWVVSHAELLRIQHEGLLPIRTPTQ
jgi:hypothetical protein